MNPFPAFCQQVVKEKLTAVIFVGFVVLLAIICSLASMTVPLLNLTLPQPKLAAALFGFAGIIAGFSYIAFCRAQVASKEKSVSTEGDSPSVASLMADSQPRVRVLVSSEGEGMSFWKLDRAGELRAWLDVVNFTTEPVKIDRIIGEITVCNSTVAKLGSLGKETIHPLSASRVYVQAELSPQNIKNIEFQLQHATEPGAGLNLTVYLHTEGTEVELRPRLITGNVRFVNFPRKADA